MGFNSVWKILLYNWENLFLCLLTISKETLRFWRMVFGYSLASGSIKDLIFHHFESTKLPLESLSMKVSMTHDYLSRKVLRSRSSFLLVEIRESEFTPRLTILTRILVVFIRTTSGNAKSSRQCLETKNTLTNTAIVKLFPSFFKDWV